MNGNKELLAVAATFTADPIEEALHFWIKNLNIPLEIEFSEYNQIFQQLLNPNSLFSSNKKGVNLILLRLEDWLREKIKTNCKIDEVDKKGLYKLSNGMHISCLNEYEADYLFKEIFLDQVYIKNGILLRHDSVVFDIGANIGMFSLFIQSLCPESKIYAFEPAPPVYEILKFNTSLYNSNVMTFNCGISGIEGTTKFTFYPNSSVFSGFHAEKNKDEEAIRTIINNMVTEQLNMRSKENADIEKIVDDLVQGRLQQQEYQCKLRTISSIIKEHNIEYIDLLKIDAEKSEFDILKGIMDDDWAKIRQIVLEVHDEIGSMHRDIVEFLKIKGFECIIEEEIFLHKSGLKNIYAKKIGIDLKNVEKEKSKISNNVFQKNIATLEQALSESVRRTNVPHLLVFCPNTPLQELGKWQNSIYEQLEESISENVKHIQGLDVITSNEIFKMYSTINYYDPYGDKNGHTPFTPIFYTALATFIARKLRTIMLGKPYKVLVLDCDQTLWKGTVGEEGVIGIELDEPRKELQRFCVDQYNKGMLICLVSKNNEKDILEVFETRKDMILKKDHLTSWEINWEPKSHNIRSLAKKLSLGLDSFIFLDDNIIECEEVRSNCPEVLTLKLPNNSSDYPRFLENIWVLDQITTTKEDASRNKMYKENLLRSRCEADTNSFEEFIQGIELKIDIHFAKLSELERLSQLTQRTNQFNATTKRRTTNDISSLIKHGSQCYALEVKDRFGDYGLVGMIIFDAGNDSIILDTFLLSCRILGRGVEYHIIEWLGKIAKELGVKVVEIPYYPTDKNQPIKNFLNHICQNSCVKHLQEGLLFSIPIAEAIEVKKWQFLENNKELSKTSSRLEEQVQANSRNSLVVASRHSEFINFIAANVNDIDAIFKAVKSKQVKPRPLLSSEYIEPTTKLEKALEETWKNVLEIDKIGIYDSFFEIGGTSLKAVQLISLLNQMLKTEINTIALLNYPTIQKLANFLENSSEEETMQQEIKKRGAARRAKRQLAT
ncbi:FkbM family methyltransferase [Candidatus Odyssella acanthamoebae]|uniref:FkbM family methyltransferase n=1 Tax=Candidatus Odyssella acanthamoebae TaxID=91604 RepID=UPI0006899226|nr:FkbM family methyltransferase [Candidatus Paracaedibacter acanthamoebae]